MPKVPVNFRFDKETLFLLDCLVLGMESETNIKLNRTKLLEMLVKEKYQQRRKDRTSE
jgi:hypothetical protein